MKDKQINADEDISKAITTLIRECMKHNTLGFEMELKIRELKFKVKFDILEK